MFDGLSSSIYNEPIADFGAKRVLGMGGSLTGYINTGNSYDKRYCHKAPCRDSFVGKTKRKSNKHKILSSLLIGAGILATGALVVKKGGLNSKFLTGAKESVSKFFNGAKSKLVGLFKKTGTKVVENPDRFIQECFDGFDEFGKIIKK